MTSQLNSEAIALATSAAENSAVYDESSSLSAWAAILLYLLWLVFRVFNYIFFIVPSMVMSMFQMSFSITLSLLLLLVYLAIIVTLCYLIVRNKYLTRYSKETAPPKQEKLNNALHGGLDYVTGPKKRTDGDRSKNYLDEFLSAIKVFGYLERPVFHELTKNMTTQKLSENEVLYLDEKLGFSIVVEGTIQVFTKLKQRQDTLLEFDEHNSVVGEDIITIQDQQYQLLNEVKSGSPLSSLLSTLDLFSADKEQSSPPFSPSTDPWNRSSSITSLPRNAQSAAQRPQFTEDPILVSPNSSGIEPSRSSTPARPDVHNYMSSPRINMLGGQPESAVGTPAEESNFSLHEDPRNSLPEIVVRPKAVDNRDGNSSTATIAIIPSLAFQRVHSKFPKATSHIVTMVLTRLYKVTSNAVHTYLGLVKEIIDTEVGLNAIADECKLPSYLYDGVIEHFNLQRKGEEDDNMKIFAKSHRRPRKLNKENSSRYVVLASRSKPSHPGDLLSSVPLSRTSGDKHKTNIPDEHISAPVGEHNRRSFGMDSDEGPLFKDWKAKTPKRKDMIMNRSFSDEREETEETSLRIAIVENIFKLLGIDEQSPQFKETTLQGGELSTNSSLIGLSSLVGDNMSFMSDRLAQDYFGERSRQSSLGLTLRPTLRQPSHKFYSTIHHTVKMDPKESDKRTRRTPSPSRPAPPRPVDVNFVTIKNAFSKYIEVKYQKPGSVLVEQNDPHSGLYYVIDGSLDVHHASRKENESVLRRKKLHTVKAGGLAGYLSSVVGVRSLVSVRCPEDSGAIVAYISRDDFARLMDKFYFLQLPVATKLKNLLSSLIVTIDFALEWCHIPAGGVLCSQGDLANGFHIVLSGRFRVVRNKKQKLPKTKKPNDDLVNLVDETNPAKQDNDKQDFEVLGEYGHGSSIGEVEVLTASRRTTSLIAVRDSETARIPRTLFEMLSLQNPSIMVKVSRIVANRVLEMNSREKQASLVATMTQSSATEINSDYKTITILPSVNGLPVREFADRLVNALKAIGRSVIALDRTSTLTHLGRHAFDERLAQLKLSGHFAYLEEEYQTVVYICDSPLKSTWTSTCISQGDCILLLADAEDDDCATNIGDYERLLVKLKTTARTDLCLIHSEKNVIPGSTSIWLKNRIWVQGHHHIQMEIPRESKEKRKQKKPNLLADLAYKLSTKANPNIKLKFENVKSRAMASLIKLNDKANKTEHIPLVYKNDFLRLARILSNEAVGLVLGGGGSRGISHVGVVAALEKHGIPVDIIGGTSIGSFVGGAYARDYNVVTIYGMTKKFSKRIGSLWRLLTDVTYPVTSYITGYEFNRGIWKVFGVHEIEDFWVRYFCNSTNITNSTMEIHERGYAWRFIRASMSLAGLLPPITYNGSMLLDGGYLDNLPVMEMKNKGAKYIIAVDVGSVDDRTPMNYGDTLSGFWVLLNRYNPFSKHPDVPSMMDIQLRLAYVASVNALELAKRTPGVIYLRPPIDDYATLDFQKFDEIYNVGLAYADERLTTWKNSKKLPDFAGVNSFRLKEGNLKRRIYRRNSI